LFTERGVTDGVRTSISFYITNSQNNRMRDNAAYNPYMSISRMIIKDMIS